MMVLSYLILIICVPKLSFCGYFEVEMTDGRKIEGNGLIELDLKVQRANRTTYAIGGTFKTNVELDDSFQLRTQIFKKQGNEYRLTPFHIGPNNFCDYIKNKALLFDELKACSDIPERDLCPWPAKTYNINKCLVPEDKVPKYLSGDYRVDVELLRDEDTVGGYQIFFYVMSLVG